MCKVHPLFTFIRSMICGNMKPLGRSARACQRHWTMVWSLFTIRLTVAKYWKGHAFRRLLMGEIK